MSLGPFQNFWLGILATSLEVWAYLHTVVLIVAPWASPEACEKCRISATPRPTESNLHLNKTSDLFATLHLEKYFLMLLEVVGSQSLSQPPPALAA